MLFHYNKHLIVSLWNYEKNSYEYTAFVANVEVVCNTIAKAKTMIDLLRKG